MGDRSDLRRIHPKSRLPTMNIGPVPVFNAFGGKTGRTPVAIKWGQVRSQMLPYEKSRFPTVHIGPVPIFIFSASSLGMVRIQLP